MEWILKKTAIILWNIDLIINRKELRKMLTHTDFENYVIDAIGIWLEEPGNVGRWVTGKELHDESKVLVTDEKKKYMWPESIKTFGRRIMYATDLLVERFGMEKRIRNKAQTYRFNYK